MYFPNAASGNEWNRMATLSIRFPSLPLAALKRKIRKIREIGYAELKVHGKFVFKKSHSCSSHFITPSVRLPARNDTRWKNEIFRAGRMKCNAHRADVWNCQVYALFPDACASAQVLPPVLLNACLNELLIFNKIQTKSKHKRPVKGNISTCTNPAMET